MRGVRTLAQALLLLPAYGLFAYVVMPVTWTQYERLSSPGGAAGITRTAEGIPGDPLNVALVGTLDEVLSAMKAAGWTPADRITLGSGIRDAASILFNRSYPSAPVSTHFLWDRPQDLAFEQIVGGSPRHRHHVRLWQTGPAAAPGRPLWLGAATFDRSVGFSRYTGEVMHHIDSRVDLERAKLFADLGRAGRILQVACAESLAAGRALNGAGDSYDTDGRLCVGVLKE